MESASGEGTEPVSRETSSDTQRSAQQPAPKRRRCAESSASTADSATLDPLSASASAEPAEPVVAAAVAMQEEQQPSGGDSSAKVDSRSPKKRKRKVFLFGNYDAYYKYRGGPVGSEQRASDPRLQLLQGAWFEGRSVLDIGCNSGLITFALAEQFAPRSILGVDIDGNLIRRAQNRLTRLQLTAATAAATTAATTVDGKAAEAEGQIKSTETGRYPHNIEFRTENFVARKHRRRKQRDNSDGSKTTGPANTDQQAAAARVTTYEIILCLSVSKWIHLNWGDAGLKTLFRRVWESLPTDGTGLFILEPQPWYVRTYIASCPRACSF